MTANEDTLLEGQERIGESDDEQHWKYTDDGYTLAAPETRQAVVSGGTATSTAERLHEDLTVETEAAARHYGEFQPKVRLGVECDRIDDRLSFSAELDADEARELAHALEESAREAEEIVVAERVRTMEGDE